MWVMPPPSSPSRFAAGTRQSSNTRSLMEEPRMPHLGVLASLSKPGQSRSTTKLVRRPSSLA